MSEVVQRAASAIQNKLCNMDEQHDRCALIATDAQAEQLARAAIEAIREPTEAMISKAMAPYIYGNDEAMNKAFRETIRSYWRAMLEEVLE
jgi:hypothetical protein